MKERGRRSYEQREAAKRQERREERRQMSGRERKAAKREDRNQAKKERARNKEFARVTYIFVTLFLVMMGYIVYFHLMRSDEFVRSPYNQRQDSLAERIVRGKILDRSGKVLAQTKTRENGKEYREYPYGDMFAHVVATRQEGRPA